MAAASELSSKFLRSIAALLIFTPVICTASMTMRGGGPPSDEPVAFVDGPAEVVSPTYYLALDAPATVKLGEEFEFTVELESRGAHKVNEEYPIRLTMVASEGFSATKDSWRREDARGDSHHVVFPARAKAKAKGRQSLQLKLSFSVCTDDQCLIESQELRHVVEVL